MDQSKKKKQYHPKISPQERLKLSLKSFSSSGLTIDYFVRFGEQDYLVANKLNHKFGETLSLLAQEGDLESLRLFLSHEEVKKDLRVANLEWLSRALNQAPLGSLSVLVNEALIPYAFKQNKDRQTYKASHLSQAIGAILTNAHLDDPDSPILEALKGLLKKIEPAASTEHYGQEIFTTLYEACLGSGGAINPNVFSNMIHWGLKHIVNHGDRFNSYQNVSNWLASRFYKKDSKGDILAFTEKHLGCFDVLNDEKRVNAGECYTVLSRLSMDAKLAPSIFAIAQQYQNDPCGFALSHAENRITMVHGLNRLDEFGLSRGVHLDIKVPRNLIHLALLKENRDLAEAFIDLGMKWSESDFLETLHHLSNVVETDSLFKDRAQRKLERIRAVTEALVLNAVVPESLNGTKASSKSAKSL